MTFARLHTVNSRISRNGAKANYGQPSQQEGTKNTKSPQFKHVESDHWAGSRKSSLAPFRLIREFTVEYGALKPSQRSHLSVAISTWRGGATLLASGFVLYCFSICSGFCS